MIPSLKSEVVPRQNSIRLNPAAFLQYKPTMPTFRGLHHRYDLAASLVVFNSRPNEVEVAELEAHVCQSKVGHFAGIVEELAITRLPRERSSAAVSARQLLGLTRILCVL